MTSSAVAEEGGVLLDTHVLVWWVSDQGRLSREAAVAIEQAPTVCVSAVSSWEIALLADVGRLRLDRSVAAWSRDVLARPRVTAVPLDAATAVDAVALGRQGFHRDPADRFLWATAARRRIPLVTKDEQIHAFGRTEGGVPLIW